MTAARSRPQVLQELQANLQTLDDLDHRLSQKESQIWKHPATAQAGNPTGILELHSLLERYQKARATYLQRRLRKEIVDQLPKYVSEEETGKVLLPQNHKENTTASANSIAESRKKTQELEASLQEKAESIQESCNQLHDLYQSVVSRREELRWMIKDLISEEENEDEDTVVVVADDSVPVQQEELDWKQKQIDNLQQTKRKLQQELSKLKDETAKAQSRLDDQASTLEDLTKNSNENEKPKFTTPDEFRAEIKKYEEMKLWYDSMTEVMEELGGMKVQKVGQGEGDDRDCFSLDVLLLDECTVRILLEPTLSGEQVKVRSAHWLDKEAVQFVPEGNEESSSLSLTLPPLDDLVQVAQTTLPPVYDLRFVAREALARWQCMQDRLEMLVQVRSQYLTKVVEKSDSINQEVLCSLNCGLVAVLHFYGDNTLVLHQLVGVGGWDSAQVESIQAKVLDIQQEKDGYWTPLELMEAVEQAVQASDFALAPTPRLPAKANPFEDEDDDAMEEE